MISEVKGAAPGTGTSWTCRAGTSQPRANSASRAGTRRAKGRPAAVAAASKIRMRAIVGPARPPPRLLQLAVDGVDRAAPARLHRHARGGHLVDVDRGIEGAHHAVLARAHGGAHVGTGAARSQELVHRAPGLEDEDLVGLLLAQAGPGARARTQHEGGLAGGIVEQHALAF